MGSRDPTQVNVDPFLSGSNIKLNITHCMAELWRYTMSVLLTLTRWYLAFNKLRNLFNKRGFVGLIWNLLTKLNSYLIINNHFYFIKSQWRWSLYAIWKYKSKDATSFMIIAVRLLLESINSKSVFPLTTTLPFPVRYASKML